MERVLVTGAGGFIGHHLVTYLKARGYWVRGVDVKLPEYTTVDADEFEIAGCGAASYIAKASFSTDRLTETWQAAAR